MAKRKVTKKTIPALARHLNKKHRVLTLNQIKKHFNLFKVGCGGVKKTISRYEQIITEALTCISGPNVWVIKMRKLKAAEKALHQKLDDIQYYIDEDMKHDSDKFNLPLTKNEKMLDILNRELGLLVDHYDYVGYDKERECLFVQTDDIVLEGINFYPFIIELNFNSTGYCKCSAVKPQKRNGCPHPHVGADGYLCQGAGKDILQRRLADGLLFEYFSVAERILNTYGEHPYRTISDWK